MGGTSPRMTSKTSLDSEVSPTCWKWWWRCWHLSLFRQHVFPAPQQFLASELHRLGLKFCWTIRNSHKQGSPERWHCWGFLWMLSRCPYFFPQTECLPDPIGCLPLWRMWEGVGGLWVASDAPDQGWVYGYKGIGGGKYLIPDNPAYNNRLFSLVYFVCIIHDAKLVSLASLVLRMTTSLQSCFFDWDSCCEAQTAEGWSESVMDFFSSVPKLHYDGVTRDMVDQSLWLFALTRKPDPDFLLKHQAIKSLLLIYCMLQALVIISVSACMSVVLIFSFSRSSCPYNMCR